MGGRRNGWAVCQVWADRWSEGEGKGGVKGPLLMKPKKKGENLLRNLHHRRKIFLFYL